jgi:hypothetical protein
MGSSNNAIRSKAVRTIETALAEIGLDPAKNRVVSSAGETSWQISRGSADVMITVNDGPEGSAPRLRIVSPIVKTDGAVPVDLAVELLKLNAVELPGIAFGLFRSDIVALVAERSAAFLDRAEVTEMLAAIGHFADKYDDLLVSRYGGKRVCDLG